MQFDPEVVIPSKAAFADGQKPYVGMTMQVWVKLYIVAFCFVLK